MKLCFDSIEEVKSFVGELKGTRGRKAGGEDGEQAGSAPQPLQPPQAGMQMGQTATPGFAPGAGFPGGPQAQQGFPGGPQIDPNVMALVQRIIASMDGAIAKGQAPGAVLQWFQSEGVKAGIAEAQTATLDQIKTGVLPRMGVPVLENIAKLMNA